MDSGRRNIRRITATAAVALLAGCGNGGQSSFAPAQSAHLGSARTAAVPATGGGALGPVLTAANGGTITGWDVDAGKSFGLLSAGYKNGTALETFDLSTAKVTKIGTYQPGMQRNIDRQLVVLKIVSGDVALVDDLAFNPQNFQRNDTFPLVNPADGAKTSGRWTPPHSKDLLAEWVAGNQATATNAIMADRNTFPHKSAGLEILVSDIAKDAFQKPFRLPSSQVVEPPYDVAQDTGTGKVVVPMQILGFPFDPFESPSFDLLDPKSGQYTIFSPNNVGSGSVMGVAIDPATHLMCTTTSDDSNVEFYDLKAQTGFAVGLPGGGGEGFGGGAVAVDSINHLFIVTQPSAPSGGSIVYVYDEKGNLQETITGFNFPNTFSAIFAYVAVNPTLRIGYASGPTADQLQSFTY